MPARRDRQAVPDSGLCRPGIMSAIRDTMPCTADIGLCGIDRNALISLTSAYDAAGGGSGAAIPGLLA